MGGITLLTFKTQTGEDIPMSCYVGDIPDFTRQKFNNVNDALAYLQALFDDEYWYSTICYYKARATNDQISVLHKYLPNSRIIVDGALNGILFDGYNCGVYTQTSSRLSGPVITRSISGYSGNYASTPFYSEYSDYGTSGKIVAFKIYVLPSKYISSDGKFDLTDAEKTSDGYYVIKVKGVAIDNRLSGGSVYDVTIDPVNDAIIMSSDDYNFWNGRSIPDPFIDTRDPYSPGGISTGGGGSGSFDGSSDPISQPSLPSIQLGNLGLFTMYNPSISQLQVFGEYLWSDNFSIDDFKKIFADPASAIIGMQILPVHLTSGTVKSVKIGNIDSGVFMTSLASQWATHDCGTITIPEYWGAYLDYQPYTQMQLFLPYIGVVTVGANDLLSHAGKSLNLQYNVDALSGSCVATLKCGDSVLYHWQGNCGLQIPYTSLTYGNLLNSLVGIVSGGIQAATGNPIGGLMSAVTSGLNAFSEDIQKGGSISSAGGLMDIQVPYLIITRPSLCLPENQNTYIGYPSWVTVTLSELTGYTKVEDIHLTNIPATEQEMTEIEALLKTGVIM